MVTILNALSMSGMHGFDVINDLVNNITLAMSEKMKNHTRCRKMRFIIVLIMNRIATTYKLIVAKVDISLFFFNFESFWHG